ncbi:MAG TPA: TrkH family potassium uptake protein [Desulfatiglandales bacterium]|nr:TrkH family potassium uptake protein [Desulfatiglandales bacterium]
MKLKELFLNNPARISVIGYILFILFGTFLLMLPISVAGDSIGFVNALFTATSAVSVTGLTVVDTGSFFTIFGQVVILILIQVGGLGIMTLSTMFMVMAGIRPGMTSRTAVQYSFNLDGMIDFKSIIRDVILFTFTIEGVGVVLLIFYFLPERSFTEALFYSVFHVVSAFCNAGFALFSDSFIKYQDIWGFNIIICILIILGGIGFFVLSELRRKRPMSRRSLSRLSLHSKIVLSVTSILIISGTLLITAMEWDNTLSILRLPERFLAGFFQAVTTRTAGFNTLPIGGMVNEALFFMILLMFIGASPGSTGGGIKTSTAACLFSLGFSRLKGFEKPRIFNRSISQESVGRALSVTMMSMLVVVIGAMLMLISESGGGSTPLNREGFIGIFFEVVSAFGTVGLSTGITAMLSAAGKLVIIAVMFIGRLGPLVVAMAVSRASAPGYYYAEENIMIG